MTFSKQLFLIGLCCIANQMIHAQIKAVTETGDEVILFQDGTWEYVNADITEEFEISLNETNFTKEDKSTFLVKSEKLNIGVWINPRSWSFTKSTNNSAAEFEFQKKGEDLYGMLITEKIQIPLETLQEIALENARGVSPDIKITKKEYRIVNGIKVLMMQMAGTIQGMRFTYFGYYYSSSKGSIQLLTYTGEGLFDDYQGDMEDFLNGFTEF
ncbi:MAG TPA: hypothetical protein PKA00_03495 [Saprospiraceae bacterium]|nr:hypothetical protein [Saprospiraceae bacterium]HMQ81941.1 hypothetical protein [Saprospiraceae bacterium]